MTENPNQTVESRNFQSYEVVARSPEQAIEKAAKNNNIDPEFLEIIEEYEPDELDLETLTKEESEAGVENAEGEPVLYIVQVSFRHYMNVAEEFVREVLNRFSPGWAVEASRFRDRVVLRLDHEDPSILIGKRGATLDALQHLVFRCLLNQNGTFPDVMLDVERYREKKLVRLEKEAKRAADRALRSRRRVPLSPMSKGERKFIHHILKDFEGIKTKSFGEDPKRHIVVEPVGGVKDDRQRGGKPRGGGKSGPRRGGKFNGNQQDDLPAITAEQRAMLYEGLPNITEEEEEAAYAEDAKLNSDDLIEERGSNMPKFSWDESRERQPGAKLEDEIE